MQSDLVNYLFLITSFFFYLYLNVKKGRDKGRGAHQRDFELDSLFSREKNRHRIQNSTPPLPSKINPELGRASGVVREKVTGTGLSKLEGRHLTSPIESRKLTSEIEKRHLKSAIESRRLAVQLREEKEEARTDNEPSRASVAVKELPNLRQLMIYDTILNKPKW
jgi:hypothetical protein